MVGVFGVQDSKRIQCQEFIEDPFKFHKLRRKSTKFEEGNIIPLKEQRAKNLRDSSKSNLRRDSAIVQ